MPDTAERKHISRVLIVEDDASQRYTLTDIMREEGFDVVGCPTAAEALEQIEICEFAVAIVDQRLPDLSGTGLLEKIRERDNHLRVIIHTGYGSFESAKKAVNLGAFAYVEKLRDPSELISYVHRALRERLTRYTDDLEAEIAERKRTEGENKRLATALECAGEGVMITDPEGVIQYVNPAFTKVTAYTAKEVIGETPRILKSGKHPREFFAQMWRSVRRGEVWTGEIVNRRKDGTLYDAYVTVAPVEDAEGHLEGFVAVQRDLTERKRSEEQARRREEELAHVGRLSVMGEMAAGIAHELNQPLSAIMNFTSACTRMVESGDSSSADLLRNLERVSSLTTRAGETIRRIRDFARKRRPNRSTVDINEVIREVIALMVVGGHVGRAELRLELADDLPLVYADSVQLQQVLLNLVRNAAEAMEETPAADNVLTVRSEAADTHWVEVRVRDTGPGLDPKIKDRLFEPYATTKKEGLGMGLPISRSIIEAHGGRLVVEPGTGSGVTFRFRVPLAEEKSTK